MARTQNDIRIRCKQLVYDFICTQLVGWKGKGQGSSPVDHVDACSMNGWADTPVYLDSTCFERSDSPLVSHGSNLTATNGFSNFVCIR